MEIRFPASIEWQGEVPGHLRLLDQTRLPHEEVYLECRTVSSLEKAVRELSVRGAPAIGVAAGYGAVLAAQEALDRPGPAFLQEVRALLDRLGRARPTAVNLTWALERARRVLEEKAAAPPREIAAALLEEARGIHREDRAVCRAMGEAGAALLPRKARVLTHCNTGFLATGGEGTALAVVYRAAAAGKEIRVFADETRPLWQGARLTAWELQRAGIPVTLLCDGAAGSLLASGGVDAVLVGADRIARNGDFANKIGTYPLAVLANRHGVPFYVVAPLSTFDPSLPGGKEIPVEQRSPAEILTPRGIQVAPEDVDAWNPAFDVTPAELVTAVVTEKGVLSSPCEEGIAALLGDGAGKRGEN